MNVRLFQYPLPAPPDLEDLNAFLHHHRIAAVSHHLVTVQTGAMLVFVVQAVDATMDRTAGSPTPKTDFKELLTADEFAVFSRLREERKKWAEIEGVPVYTVFRNVQLADMVKRRARTITDLNGIPGLGSARTGKYGARLLELLAELSPEAAK